MIRHLAGKVAEKGNGRVVVDVGGVGFLVAVPARVVSELPDGGPIRLITHLHLREDDVRLFGFTRPEDLALFELLLTVSGVGPGVAMGILSEVTTADFCAWVLAEDDRALEGIRGVGKKTARRLITELKDRVAAIAPADERGKAHADAVAALMALGYQRASAQAAVAAAAKAAGVGVAVADLVRAALAKVR